MEITQSFKTAYDFFAFHCLI